MNRINQYHETVEILFNSYFKDELQKMNCWACAVGNIVAARMGYQFEKDAEGDFRWLGQKFHWPYITTCDKSVSPECIALGKVEVASTGYTAEELSDIEAAFEDWSSGIRFEEDKSDEDVMFEGLCRVLEVLKEIHEITDEDLLTTNHNRFRTHYESLTA